MRRPQSRRYACISTLPASLPRTTQRTPPTRPHYVRASKLHAWRHGPPSHGRSRFPGRDVRASRPYLFSRGTRRELVRRLLATLVLAGLDVVGLTLGLYAALVLRSVVFGDSIFWSLLWDAGPADWLRFLVPITFLIFWQAGLYASRERRAGFGRVAYSLVLVAAITLAFGWGTGYDFTTSGLIPTACVTCALVIGGLRAAYDSLTLELQRFLKVRRRVLLVGDGEGIDGLRRLLSSSGRLGAYEFAGVFAPGGGRIARGAAAGGPAGRDHPQRGRPGRGDGARARRDGAPRGRARTDRADDDGPAGQARRVRARPGRAALRAAPARPGWDRLGGQESVRRRRQPARPGRGTADLAPARARDQARLARARPLPRPSGRRRGARVRDAEVPDDGRRGRGAADARSRSRTRQAVRSSRSATIRASRASAASCAGSRSTKCHRS